MPAHKHKPRGIIRRNDYAHVDADPIIYTIRNAHAAVGAPKVAQLMRDTGLCRSTITRILDGDARNCHHSTAAFILTRGCGYRETWLPPAGSSLPTFTVKRQKARNSQGKR